MNPSSTTILFFLCFWSFTSCDSFGGWLNRDCQEEPTFTRSSIPLIDSDLKMDGYYFSDQRQELLFLYRDGTVLHSFVFDDLPPDSLIANFQREDISQIPDYGGNIQRRGDTLSFETFFMENCGFYLLTEVPKLWECLLMNDSTLLMPLSQQLFTGTYVTPPEDDIEFHFVSYRPKPDSLNAFTN